MSTTEALSARVAHLEELVTSLRRIHRPHVERGHHSDYTICFECGLSWPCNTARALLTA